MDFRSYHNDSPLLLPSNIAAELIVADTERQLTQIRAEKEKERKAAAKVDPAEKEKLAILRKRQHWDDRVESHAGPRLKLFDEEEVSVLVENFDVMDDAERHRLALKRFAERTEYSKLQTVREDYETALDDLESRMPNFVEVLEYLRGECAIARHGDRTLRPAPLLLLGSPGVGKSLFADRLADFLGSGLLALRMENAQSNAALAGSDTFWSNSKPGRLFDMLVCGEYANPLVYLDEIDKVPTNSHYDPLSALYSLLESTTAANFRDLCYPQVALNASRVLWVCTANNIETLPAPLKSRLRVFEIPSPTPEQALLIANNVIEEVIRESLAEDAEVYVENNVAEQLAALTPRRMRLAMREALGRALREQRPVCAADMPRVLEGRRIGF